MLELFTGFRPLTITYSETDFWRESFPLQDLIEIASHGNNPTIELWEVFDLKEKYLEEFRSRYPDRYNSRIAWLSRLYGKWQTYYKLSLFFCTFVLILFAKYVRLRRTKNNPSYVRLTLILLTSLTVVVLSRYQAEQYIEKTLRAELTFVTTQLQLDSQAQQSRLDIESFKKLEAHLGNKLKETYQQGNYLFLVSRILERYLGVHREFPTWKESVFLY